eukprot:TRINITY_DN4498_c0_g4_i1.p1 TRINITY_DN4498_c0_g4~~TRINITY_DN4498_c0_g4_i1.p1  ORF type:complete len:393 (-),score=99.99 TRINITY_DN4498_c0_g4_i1:313-1491(-)
MSDYGSDEDISSPEVKKHYKTAGKIVQNTLQQLISEIAPGKKVVDLCALGDKLIGDQTLKKKKDDIEKGVAFPTCISINHCAGHYSPLSGDKLAIQEGDLVKIDLGVHIGGFIVVGAHTIAVSAPDAPTTGRKADVVCAAYFALEAALRLIKPGNTNSQVTEAINKIAEQFHVSPVEGVLSHSLSKYVIDGQRVISNKLNVEHQVEEFEFEENEVYGIDVVMSTGNGHLRETDLRPTVYKRNVDVNYLLKMKTSKYVLNEINKKCPTLPFTLRALDERQARLGITECLSHNLVIPYPMLYEKPSEFVAQFKTTVFVTNKGARRQTEFPPPYVQSQYQIEEPKLKELLAQPIIAAKGKKEAGSSSSQPTATSSTSTTTSTTTETEPGTAMDLN